MGQNADMLVAAMWPFSPAKAPPSNNQVAAGSVTRAMVPWGFSPRKLKPNIDLEFAVGVNGPVIHTSLDQPVDNQPGPYAPVLVSSAMPRNAPQGGCAPSAIGSAGPVTTAKVN